MLPYIILSYVIIKSLLYTTTLLLFYIIIPILNYLNLLFNNNIQLNITLINGVQNNNIKEKTIINIKDEDNIEELESLKDESSTYEDDETEDENDETEDENDETENENDETENENDKNDETEDEKNETKYEKNDTEDDTEYNKDENNKNDKDKTENKDKELSLFEKTLSCNHKKFHQNNLLEKPKDKTYSFFDYFFTKTNKLKDTNDEDVILVDETI